MKVHTIRYEYEDGKKLRFPIYWCGRKHNEFNFAFTDTHHLALGVGGSQSPCKECIKAVIKELEKEL